MNPLQLYFLFIFDMDGKTVLVKVFHDIYFFANKAPEVDFEMCPLSFPGD